MISLSIFSSHRNKDCKCFGFFASIEVNEVLRKVIITNHHALPTKDAASKVIAIFCHLGRNKKNKRKIEGEKKEPKKAKKKKTIKENRLKPDELFYSDKV